MLKKILIAFAAMLVSLTLSAATAGLTVKLQEGADDITASGELNSLIQEKLSATIAEQSAYVNKDLLVSSGSKLLTTQRYTEHENYTVSAKYDYRSGYSGQKSFGDEYIILNFDRTFWELGINEITFGSLGGVYNAVVDGNTSSCIAVKNEYTASGNFNIKSILFRCDSDIADLEAFEFTVEVYSVSESTYNYCTKYIPECRYVAR